MRKVLIALAVLVLCYPLFHTAMFGYAWNELFADVAVCCVIATLLFTLSHLFKRIQDLEREVEEIKEQLRFYTKSE